MTRPRFLFFRGSTPTLELALPMETAPEDVLLLTLSQGGEPVLEYGIHCTPEEAGTGTFSVMPGEPSVLELTMSEADTLALCQGDVELQLRIETAAGADAFWPVHGAVGDVRREGFLA